MESEILLQRPDPRTPWGFKIVGGSDYNIPIIISKVIENSIAEAAGLKEDFFVEKINNISISGLTHAEVDEIIMAAETKLKMSVAEGDFQLSVEREFGQIIVMESDDQNYRCSNLETVQQQQLSSQFQLPRNKWSTFLQKPKNPAPKVKGQAPPIPKNEQYRVIIKKQKKKESDLKLLAGEADLKKEVVEEEVNNELKDVEVVDQPQIVEEIEAQDDLKEDPNGPSTVGEPFTTNIAEEEIEDHEGIISPRCESVADIQDVEESQIGEENFENFAQNMDTQVPDTKNEPSLEEQLAAVQRQLQELAALPSAIQDTLSEVTQQLASIVGERKSEVIPEYITDPEKNENETECLTNQDDEIIEEVQKDGDDKIENSGTAEMEGPPSDILSDICEEDEVLEMMKDDATSEESEGHSKPDQKLDNQQMDSLQGRKDEPNEMKGPIVRPIILPGGRKWTDPDDAETKVKYPKMTDEKICNTIETFSEVICGKTKGINFLKYVPPPKNLDHLQRSEVFRLIHGMEPPVKGINIRSEKILAEEDYYTYSRN